MTLTSKAITLIRRYRDDTYIGEYYPYTYCFRDDSYIGGYQAIDRRQANVDSTTKREQHRDR